MRSAIPAVLFVVALAPPALPARRVPVPRFPRGIMQPVNAAAEKDDFVVANSGPDVANVTVSATKQFFTVSPQQFVLDPRTSRTITIQPVVTAGGLYDGAVHVFVARVKDPLN